MWGEKAAPRGRGEVGAGILETMRTGVGVALETCQVLSMQTPQLGPDRACGAGFLTEAEVLRTGETLTAHGENEVGRADPGEVVSCDRDRLQR